MKAVISSTNDPVYSFFIPITAWCWNMLNVDVVCFVPGNVSEVTKFAMDTMNFNGENRNLSYGFNCPEHKEATYAQCSRLYGACLDLPEDEIIISSDIDMGVFSLPPIYEGKMTVCGVDLVPKGQVPMCYISAPVKEWRRVFKLNGRTCQQLLDNLLGSIECENFRGNYWAKDQEEAYEKIISANPRVVEIPRARPGTQFASNRVDRDDINWRSYVNDDLVDAHLWRPGYTDQNFANIMELLQMKYPEENFQWLIDYRNEYLKLL